jgi:hypothetical protein
LAWFDRSLPVVTEASRGAAPGTEIMEAVSLSPERLSALADYLGVQLAQDKEGQYLSVPSNADLSDPAFKSNFINFWLDGASSGASNEHNRQRKISTYKTMDEIIAEASISLDTYADEALGVGFVDDPVQIRINDLNVQTQVFEILGKSEIFKRYRSLVRNLLKYGDVGYRINLPGVDRSTQDIMLEYVDPSAWQCVTAKDSSTVIGYQLGERRQGYNRATSIPGDRSGHLQLWEFIQMTVFSEDDKPYGRSLLEPMRVDADHLTTMEALLALSRASKVERLIIKVPTGSTNAVQAAQKLQAVKNQFKSSIFKDSSLGTKSYARTPALTDVLFVPSDAGFDISRLPSGMDLSSTDDIVYFRDKLFTMSGLPKSYFLHDDSTQWGAGSALQQQDIMFARKLVQYQNAFAEALTRMIMILSVYISGADIAGLGVEVRLRKPPQLAGSIVEYLVNLADAAQKIVSTYQAATGAPVTPEMYSNLLAQLGMPASTAGIFGAVQIPSTSDDPRKLLTAGFDKDIVCTSDDVFKIDPFFRKRTLTSLRESLKARQNS